MVEFFQSFLWRMHRDTCGRRHPIGILAENIGVIIVKTAADRAAQFVILNVSREQTLAWIEDREIEAHLVQPAVQ